MIRPLINASFPNTKIQRKLNIQSEVDKQKSSFDEEAS